MPRPANIFTTEWMTAPATLNAGEALNAIGDVHGRLDLLRGLVGFLQAEVIDADGVARQLVMLGDYVDRGPDSIATLSYLNGLKLEGAALHVLRGNHEEYLDAFLHAAELGPRFTQLWLNNGGRATLAELGIGDQDFATVDLESVRQLALPLCPRRRRARRALLRRR